MKTYIYEIVFAVAILLLLLFLINPFDLLMPSMADMVVAVILVVVFSLFAGFVWKENGGDEREVFHKMLADRIAYLAGSGAILLAIIIKILNHQIDVWLIGALAVMILAKIAGLMYGRLKH